MASPGCSTDRDHDRSNITSFISSKQPLNLSTSEVAFAVGTVYLLGEVTGTLFFGRLADKWGGRNLFLITLDVYLFGGLLSALTVGHSHFWVYWLWGSHFIAGMGMGGEYAASTRASTSASPPGTTGESTSRGTVPTGAAPLDGTLTTLLVVNHLFGRYSWRVAFLFGPVLRIRHPLRAENLPESPRWLIMRGREEEAEAAVRRIESATEQSGGVPSDVDESKSIEITPADRAGAVRDSARGDVAPALECRHLRR